MSASVHGTYRDPPHGGAGRSRERHSPRRDPPLLGRVEFRKNSRAVSYAQKRQYRAWRRCLPPFPSRLVGPGSTWKRGGHYPLRKAPRSVGRGQPAVPFARRVRSSGPLRGGSPPGSLGSRGLRGRPFGPSNRVPAVSARGLPPYSANADWAEGAGEERCVGTTGWVARYSQCDVGQAAPRCVCGSGGRRALAPCCPQLFACT